MSLSSLPTELILKVSQLLPTFDKFNLSRTNRRLYVTIPAPGRNEIFAVLTEREHRDEYQTLRTCTRCIRLLPFYHFSRKQGQPRITKRICLRCSQEQASTSESDPGWLLGTSITLCPVCKQFVICECWGVNYNHNCDRCRICKQPFSAENVGCGCTECTPNICEPELIVARLIQKFDFLKITSSQANRLRLSSLMGNTGPDPFAMYFRVFAREGEAERERELEMKAQKRWQRELLATTPF